MTDKERLEEIMDKIAYVRDEYLDDKVVSEYYGHDITSEIVGCPISALSCIGDYIKLLQKRVQELEDIIYQDERQDVIEGLYEENKRYREALRKIIKEGENGEYSHYTAQRALEEKTDE